MAQGRANTPSAATPPGALRIVGGQWRGRRIAVPANGVRPTPDRVRETLFNWLGQDLSGWRCMDACAGSGALGWEAASRGARQVIMLECDAARVAHLRRTQALLGERAQRVVQIERAQALEVLRRMPPHSLELILLDPPFDAPWYAQALQAARALIVPQGFVYLEAGRACSAETLGEQGWQLWRYLKAGMVHAHLLRAA